MDDDTTAPSFSIGNASITEGGLMTFTVTRTGDAQAEQTVDFATSIGASDTAGTGDFTAASGTLTFAQGETSKTFTVQTTQDALYEGDETFTATLSNATGGAAIGTASATGTIINVNQAPVITSNGGGATASINVAENTTAVTKVTATDAETNTVLTFSISGGADKALFQIDAATGVLSFKSAPNYEAPGDVGSNNVYDVQVTVTDNGGLTDVQDIAVTVTNVNEAPTITTPSYEATYREGQDSTTVPVGSTQLAATDPEDGANVMFYFTNGTTTSPDGFYTIDPATGKIYLANISSDANIYANGSPIHKLEVVAVDTGDLVSAPITVTLTETQMPTINLNRLVDMMSTTVPVTNNGDSGGTLLTSDQAERVVISEFINNADLDGYPPTGINAPTLFLGGGNDILEVGKTIDGYSIQTYADVYGGTGNDTFILAGGMNATSGASNADRSSLYGEQGGDVITLGGALSGGIILAGSGSDTITINSYVNDRAIIDLGTGDSRGTDYSGTDTGGDSEEAVNTLTITGDFDGAFLYGSQGQDIVTINGQIKGSNTIDLGDGDDIFTYGGTTISGVIAGGAGTDTLVLTTTANVMTWGTNNATNLSSANFTGFEVIRMDGNNVVDLKYSDLLNDTTNTGPLYIQGQSGDKVDLGWNNFNSDGAGQANLADGNGTWVKGASKIVDKITYDVYHHSSAGADTSNDVYIQQGIIVI
ncbi:MAG: cadherin domain-containing protein [Pseudomonadota bacterium]|nr:cadherin domain-containing protein [Pseudomonadota bacterium]